MILQALLYWISIAGILLAGTFVLVRQRKEAHIYYAFFSYSVAFWLATQFFVDRNLHTAFWLGLGLIAIELIAPIFMALASSYPSSRFDKRRFGILLAVPLLAFGPFSFSWLLVKQSAGPDGPTITLGPLYSLQTIIILLYVVAALVILIYRLRSMQGQERSQAYLFFVAFIPFVVGSFLTGFVFVNNASLQFLRPLTALLMIITLSYAMIYYKLFDLRFFVIRATAYIFTTLVLGALYVAPAMYIIAIVIMGFPFVFAKFVLGVLAGTIAAMNYEKIRTRFNKATNKIFFRDSYDSAALLGDLNKTLVSTIDLNKMLHESANLLATNIKSEFCSFVLLKTKESPMRILGVNASKLSVRDLEHIEERINHTVETIVVTDTLEPTRAELKSILSINNIAVLIRLSNSINNSADDFGYILLGYKRSGNLYDKKDMHTLVTVANTLTIAIQNAIRFEEIQHFNVTLQQKVEDATQQLRRTNAKLKAMDETKDDFISMASHQLRTPLTSMKGYVSMVLEGDGGKLTALQRKMLAQAYASSQRMVFLIADLLNVSRLKTGKFVIELVKLDLVKLVQDEVDQLKQTAVARSLTLTYDKPEGAFPEVMLDETKTRQVIMNFIDNAIYYTPSGGHIVVKLSQTPSSIELRVSDDGIGVPKHEQPHLFTKFYRAGNARNARPDGTGLGLFMAKKVIIAQGGAVIFESKEGKGSTFGFMFSKQKVLASATPAEKSASN